MTFNELIKYLDENSSIVRVEGELDEDGGYSVWDDKVIHANKIDESSKMISRYIMDKLALRAKYIKERNLKGLNDANNKIHELLNYHFDFGDIDEEVRNSQQ